MAPFLVGGLCNASVSLYCLSNNNASVLNYIINRISAFIYLGAGCKSLGEPGEGRN
jgi:hypothetical protein